MISLEWSPRSRGILQWSRSFLGFKYGCRSGDPKDSLSVLQCKRSLWSGIFHCSDIGDFYSIESQVLDSAIGMEVLLIDALLDDWRPRILRVPLEGVVADMLGPTLLGICITEKEKYTKMLQLNKRDFKTCKVIYEEGLPNIWGNAQIFSHIWGGR